MVDPDVVTAKLDIIDRCLQRIAEVRGERRKDLQPVDIEDITALNLQRAIQGAIDLAAHVVAEEGYGVPDSTAAVFTLLQERGVIDRELAGRLRRMVGFRNIAVHEYRTVDPAIVETIVEKHLDDLRLLGARVVGFFELG
ncbi:MAG: hypothetical protein QOJ16_4507 [Acidobacteriota bacterium]|jgi:uncharacterized protein YutE (UPF0331/DUF86 family)|nr:hypothetical protein [Acidobacteriota bacterium]